MENSILVLIASAILGITLFSFIVAVYKVGFNDGKKEKEMENLYKKNI